MKAIAFAVLAAATFAATAGEDSTHRWGGTGPNWWDTPCGLRGFASAQPDTEAPCTGPAPQEMSLEEMRAWIAQHTKAMDDMMSRMNAEHRAMMGGSGRGGPAPDGTTR